MLNTRMLLIGLLVGTAFAAGCRTNLLSGDESPAGPAQPAAPPAPVVVDGVRTSYADVVERSAAAVVRIEAFQKARPAGQELPFGDDMFRQFQVPRQQAPIERGMGSGVIVSGDGTILTNAHVIEGAERINVLTQDNKSYDAKVVGTDAPSDLAVLKIEAENTPYLTLGNSDNVRVGDIVLAIGNPLGIGQTVTAGIISAKGRRTGLSDGSYEDFLQTDAPINRGNSGGALVNLNSELIGINSQILSSPGSAGGNIGIGFSIPSNMAKSVMDQLLQNGRVRRGMLGINIQNLTEETAQALELSDSSGVIVSNVQQGSAADKAGIKRGDIVVAINGEKIEDSNVLRNKVAGTTPGSQITLTIKRDGSEQQLTATLDEFQSSENTGQGGRPGPQDGGGEAPAPSGRLGLTLQPLTPETSRQLQLPDGTEGMVVTAIDPTGAAAVEGIVRGDVILEINRQPVRTLDEVQAAMERSGTRPMLLLISRRGQTIFLTVRPR